MAQTYYAAVLGDSPRIDKEAGIIRGVCVMALGEVSDRGLYVDDVTLSQLVTLCGKYANGVKVKADHGSGIMSVSGILRNFRIKDGAARADLHLLASDTYRDKLLEMAEEIPDTFGLSVSIEQEVEEYRGHMGIRPTAVFSVDLVTDPAACPSGLFSQQDNHRRIDAATTNKMTPDEMTGKFAALEKTVSDFISDFSARFKKFETDPKVDDEKLANLSKAIADTRADFSKQLTETSAELMSVAAEFSKVIGTVTVVKVSPAETLSAETGSAKSDAANFEKLAKDEFAKTSSKTAAMKFAITEDAKLGGKGYAAFMKAGKPVNYSKASN